MMGVIRNTLTAAKRIAGYQARIALKKARAKITPSSRSEDLASTPPVTVFITNANNRYPLELTLRTLVHFASYPDYEIWVADNGSTDGSIEMVQDLMHRDWPIHLIRHGEARPQHEWYDYMSSAVETPLWIGIHEDIFFLKGDWIADLVRVMLENPDLLLLGGEYFPPAYGAIEPVSHETVDLLESLSTWIFCARRELHETVDTSFAFYKTWDSQAERMTCYDQGGKLMADLRDAGYDFMTMPKYYLNKFVHIGNISWAFKHSTQEAQKRYKLHQIDDAQRRALRWARRNASSAF